MSEYIPDTGDIIWIDFDPQRGNEIQKRRPALVITSQIYRGEARGPRLIVWKLTSVLTSSV